MNETLFLIYFPVWFALAIGSFLFFRGRGPAFKKRWFRKVYGFNIAIIGGFIVALTVPHWQATVIFAAGVFFMLWIALFRTRVCPECGRICQPENLITPQDFCSKCGAELETSPTTEPADE